VNEKSFQEEATMAATPELPGIVLSLDTIDVANLDTALLCVDTTLSGAGLRIRHGRLEAPLSTRKAHLKEFSVSREVTSRLKEASPREVQEYADRGLFKVLCMNLNEIDSNVAMLSDRMIVTISNLISMMRALPDRLCIEAWTYGAVRPVTKVFKVTVDHLEGKSWKAFMADNGLILTLNFISTMGIPLDLQDDSAPAWQIAAKFYRWFCKEGYMERVFQTFISVSTVDLPALDKRHVRLQPLVTGALGVVIVCMRLDLMYEEMTSRAGTVSDP
jgi:hypothetical protein